MSKEFFNDDRVEELKTAFNLKADDNGVMPTREIANLMRSMGLDPSTKETIECETRADPDMTGNVKFEAFLDVIKDRCDVPFNDEKLEKGFKVLQNQSKKVPLDELKHYLKSFNDETITNKQLEEFASKVPVQGKNVDVDS